MLRVSFFFLLLLVGRSKSLELAIEISGDVSVSIDSTSPESIITWDSLLSSQYKSEALYLQMPYVYSIPVNASYNVQCENYISFVQRSATWTIISAYLYFSSYIHLISYRGGTKIMNKRSRRGSKEFSHNQDHMIHKWISMYVPTD